MSKQLEKNEKAYRPSSPEQSRREARRIDIRRGDGLEAEIRLAGSNESFKARVFDVSLMGLSIIVPPEYVSIVQQFKNYEINIIRSWSTPVSVMYTCVWTEALEEGGAKCGLRIMQKENSEFEVASSISSQVSIPDSMPIIGYMYKDLFYNERVSLEIKSMGKSGLSFVLRDTELMLIPGMTFEIALSVRTTSGDRIRGVVEGVQVAGGKALVVASIDEITKGLEKDLVAHLLNDDNFTPQQLRDAGFKVKKIANNFKFRFARTEEEYEEVLSLRKKAYEAAGKASEKSSIDDMRAPLDSISRILIAYHGNKIVGSCAMSFPHSEFVRLDTERSLEFGYPDDLPSKLEVIEISRLCTDPAYRRGDLLVRMFEHIYRVFLISDRNYLLTSTDKKLWPLYKGIGFTKTKHHYDHPVFTGIDHNIILVPKQLGSHAKALDPLRWNFLYRDMTDFMNQRLPMHYSWFYRTKLSLYKLIGKILKINRDPRY